MKTGELKERERFKSQDPFRPVSSALVFAEPVVFYIPNPPKRRRNAETVIAAARIPFRPW
jgi:hypothetical protein